MTEALSDPSQDVAPTILDLNNKQSRATFTAAAMKGFMIIADEWGLDGEQRRTLLGGVARNTYQKWARGDLPAAFNRDQLERMSLTTGIYKSLVLLFADQAGRLRWFTSPNRDIPFAGRSPLDHMLLGGMDHLYQVRRYVDAWRGMQ